MRGGGGGGVITFLCIPKGVITFLVSKKGSCVFYEVFLLVDTDLPSGRNNERSLMPTSSLICQVIRARADEHVFLQQPSAPDFWALLLFRDRSLFLPEGGGLVEYRGGSWLFWWAERGSSVFYSFIFNSFFVCLFCFVLFLFCLFVFVCYIKPIFFLNNLVWVLRLVSTQA